MPALASLAPNKTFNPPMLDDKAVTGCLHFMNKTPIMSHSKKQATAETATYGAEFSAARTCLEQVIDLRQTLRYLGVRVHETSYVFGDNQAMVHSSKFPEARLNKRHNILSFHFVRDIISKGYISMNHIRSGSNIADILSKHWSHKSAYPLIRPVFNYIGDTGDLFIDDYFGHTTGEC